MKRNEFAPPEVFEVKYLPQIISQIAEKREQPNTADLLVPHIDRVIEMAEVAGEHSYVLQLIQERFLVSEHKIMDSRFSKDLVGMAQGAFLMRQSAIAMEKCNEAYHDVIDPAISARTDRHLGRYYDRLHQYSKSEKHYRAYLDYLDSKTDVVERSPRLESAGLLAYSQLKQIKPGALEFTLDSLRDFDNSTEGRWYKEVDYSTWAIWKSGIEIRTANHLAKSKNPEKIQIAKTMLLDSQSILYPNDNFDTSNFGTRREQLKKSQKRFKL
jgi:hypothetical protein